VNDGARTGRATGSTRAPGSARAELLARATDHVAAHGIGDTSLRAFAAALGTSHRMLIYHFGSRDGLLAAIVEETEARQRAALADLQVEPDIPFTEIARRMWRRLEDPALWPLERLFFELYGRALQGEPGTEGFLDAVMEPWFGPLTRLHEDRGASPAEARARARLGVAVTRGLLLDLLATGDRAGVEQAMEAFLALVDSNRPG
jgi:AcrR family transcriptional regulator